MALRLPRSEILGRPSENICEIEGSDSAERMFRRSGCRFADKNMRKARAYGRFRPQQSSDIIQYDRKRL
jgi:hypothetical protein